MLLSKRMQEKILQYRDMPATLFENVYLFLLEACNLNCRHCYMGKRLNNPLMIDKDACFQWLKLLRELGGKKLCLLGGEPTLYPYLADIMHCAKDLGYSQIIIGTNAVDSSAEVIYQLNSDLFTSIQTSLEGCTASTHDMIRGDGTFSQTIRSLREFQKRGFDTKIVYTVNRKNSDEAIDVLDLVADLGVSHVKYHIFSDIGNGADIGTLKTPPLEWIDFCSKLKSLKGKYPMRIQYQNAYETKKSFGEFVCNGYYKGCIGQQLERISVLPSGDSYICSCYFDTDRNMARIMDGCLDTVGSSSEYDDFFVKNVPGYDGEFFNGCPASYLFNEDRLTLECDDILHVCRLWKTTI